MGASWSTMWPLVAVGVIIVVVVTAAFILKHRVPRLNLRGKTVLITGGSTGIGFELAVAMAAKGALVAIAARREAQLKDAVASIEKRVAGAKVTYVVMDVSDAQSIDDGLAQVRAWSSSVVAGGSGEIDVAVCSAGYSYPARFLDIPERHATGMMNTNFFGCANIARRVLPRMYARKSGRLIFVSSMAGAAPVAGFSMYGPTKAAIRAFAQSLDMESFTRNVRVQIINPPDVETPGFDEENKVKSEECKQICALGGAKPMKPEEFARDALKQVEDYAFQVNVGLDGWLLGSGVAGMDPPAGALQLAFEVFFGGLLRLVSAVYVKLHYGIVADVHKKAGLTGEASTSTVN